MALGVLGVTAVMGDGVRFHQWQLASIELETLRAQPHDICFSTNLLDGNGVQVILVL